MADLVEPIGLLAGMLTTMSFVPQAVRTWRLGGHELSWAMLGLFASGLTLWLIYGVLLGSTALVLANGLTLAQVAVMAGVKFTHARRSP